MISALVAAIASIEPSSSTCTGPTLVITRDVGLGDRAELGDLARAPHPHLEHEDVGALGGREDRERQADLGVEVLGAGVHAGPAGAPGRCP